MFFCNRNEGDDIGIHQEINDAPLMQVNHINPQSLALIYKKSKH